LYKAESKAGEKNLRNKQNTNIFWLFWGDLVFSFCVFVQLVLKWLSTVDFNHVIYLRTWSCKIFARNKGQNGGQVLNHTRKLPPQLQVEWCMNVNRLKINFHENWSVKYVPWTEIFTITDIDELRDWLLWKCRVDQFSRCPVSSWPRHLWWVALWIMGNWCCMNRLWNTVS
jgi:hypothetical protein